MLYLSQGDGGLLHFHPHAQHPKTNGLFLMLCVFYWVFFLVEVEFLSQKFRGEGVQECQFVRSTFAFLGVPRLLVHFEDLLLQP